MRAHAWLCRWLRPTCEAVGMWGGFTGTGVKTIVPAKATAKFVCRLVPDQDPDTILQVRFINLPLGFGVIGDVGHTVSDPLYPGERIKGCICHWWSTVEPVGGWG